MFWKLGGEGPRSPQDCACHPRAGVRGGGLPLYHRLSDPAASTGLLPGAAEGGPWQQGLP